MTGRPGSGRPRFTDAPSPRGFLMLEHDIPAAAEFLLQRQTTSAASTAHLGARAAQLLQGGESLLLYGPLGIGKTCFVQGLCRGLGVREEVISPTFSLVHRYSGRLVVHHLDFYRLGPRDDLTDIGVEEVLDEVADGAAVLVAEWPERLAPLLPTRLEWLALPGPRPQDRIWHLRGIPELPAPWREFFAVEGDAC